MAAFAFPAIWRTGALTANEFELREEPTAASLAALTKRKEQSFEIASNGGTRYVIVTTHPLPVPAWVEATISALIGIQSLPDNWDSCGAKKINRDLISQSLSLLEQIMETTSPAPSVVPLGNGGLQFEWHRRQQDLEIAFPADEAPQFFYRNRATGTDQEGFASDVTKLISLLRGAA